MSDKLKQDLDKALTVCSEAYQIVGALAHYTGTFDHPDVVRALDRLSDPIDSTDEDILPWPKADDWKKTDSPQIGVGVIVRYPGKGIVWLRRAGTSHGNGEWSLPGGRLEFEETLEACAIREVREEIGIEISEIKRIDYISEDFFQKENMHWITHYFLVYSNDKPVLMEPDKADEMIIIPRSTLGHKLPEKIFPGAEGAIAWIDENDAW